MILISVADPDPVSISGIRSGFSLIQNSGGGLTLVCGFQNYTGSRDGDLFSSPGVEGGDAAEGVVH